MKEEISLKFKRVVATLLTVTLTLTCMLISVGAEDDTPIARVSERIDQSISANTIAIMEDTFSLDVGDIIKYDCTYTPKSASLDFGFVAPDGLFYSLNTTSGSFSKSFKVEQRGQFALAIRNNASYSATVTGTVKY